MNAVPSSLRLDPVAAPDADYETLRQQAMTLLAGLSGGRWTDHNVTDPGVTLVEAVLWGLADLHFRTDTIPLEAWSGRVGMGRAAPDRHWGAGALPPIADWAALADALAGLDRATVAAVRAATVPADALRVLTPGLAHQAALSAARLIRAPLLLRAAYDGSAAVAAATDRPEPAAVAALRTDPACAGLWDDELTGLLRRHRRRELNRAIRERTKELRRVVSAAADVSAAEAALAVLLGADPVQTRDALAVHPSPPGGEGELWEQPGGETTCWPPHPLQARTVEPVTAADYARLARTVAGVRRAWAVPLVLPGIGWDGAPVAGEDGIRAGAVTLLVEAHPEIKLGNVTARRAFLRTVLAGAVGGEVPAPYALLEADLDQRSPRRVLGDEVGAALIDRCPVTVRGVVYVPVTARRAEVLGGVRHRIGELFRHGRPESAPAPPHPRYPRDTDGPWPLPPPPGDGWIPGEPVRVAELVQAAAKDPVVLGVEGFAARTEGSAWYADALPVPAHCVPELAPTQCVTVRLELRTGCGDGG